MIPVLAFVPPDNVVAYFEELADHPTKAFNKNCDDLLDYFEENYIGRCRRNAPQRAQLFSINLEYVLQSIRRTTDNNELHSRIT